MGKSTRGRIRIQLVDDLLEAKNYADLKKAAEDRNVWRTTKRECLIYLLSEQITNE